MASYISFNTELRKKAKKILEDGSPKKFSFNIFLLNNQLQPLILQEWQNLLRFSPIYFVQPY